MSYDEEMAERLREELAGERGVTEMRMFGGLAFLVGGHLAVCASGSGGLMLRVDPADTADLIADPLAERFVMRGRELNGWLRVSIGADDETLGSWVNRGVAYARSLPPKNRPPMNRSRARKKDA